MSFLIFGYGFIGRAFAELANENGHRLYATARDVAKRQKLEIDGIAAIDPTDQEVQRSALKNVKGILVTAPPDDEGCPAFAALSPLLSDAHCHWIAYLSTTGVYGDAGGKWVDEQTPPNPSSREGKNRLKAEQQWLSLKHKHNVMIFRLPGLYGEGRNVFERLMSGNAKSIIAPDHVFSRLHHEDAATGLYCAYQHPHAGGIYNLCDDEPASASMVMDYGADLIGVPPPPQIRLDDPLVSPQTKRFYQDNKRVSNALAKAQLGWRPNYPTYREGLKAILHAQQKCAAVLR